jgi:hypothetical protein
MTRGFSADDPLIAESTATPLCDISDASVRSSAPALAEFQGQLYALTLQSGRANV